MSIRESIKNLGKGITSLVSKKEQVYKPETLGEMLKNASDECKTGFYTTFYWLHPEYPKEIEDITDDELLVMLQEVEDSIVGGPVEDLEIETKPAKVVKKTVTKKSAVKKTNKKK